MGSNFTQLGILLTIYLILGIFGKYYGLTTTYDFFIKEHIATPTYDEEELKELQSIVGYLAPRTTPAPINTAISGVIELIVDILSLPVSIVISTLPLIVKIPLTFLSILTIIAVYNAIRGNA